MASYYARLSEHGNGFCLKGSMGIIIEINRMETGYFYKLRMILSDPDRHGEHNAKLTQWFPENELEAIMDEWGAECI
jgi:hypothetical protein